MIAGMDYLATIPPIVGVISNLSAITLQLLAERLLTIVLAGFIVGSVTVWASTELLWLWIKRAIGGLHTLPRLLPH
jgi:hypothetical protein